MRIIFILPGVLLLFLSCNRNNSLTLNKNGYFEMPGLNVTVFADIYPEGHQTGITIIQHGERVAANGDVRLEVSPGQWSPIPKAGDKIVDSINNTITQFLWFPDSSRNNRGFNPISYPDLVLKYNIEVSPIKDNSFKLSVNLEEPIPKEWQGQVGFNIELFPGHLFGKTYIIDNKPGIFPLQANGPLTYDKAHYITRKIASGKKLVVAPESDLQRITFETNGTLELYDGRGNHNNGWFVVRENLKPEKTTGALEWTITPNVDKNWKYEPVIHVSQVGYHPLQPKKALIETDPSIKKTGYIQIIQITDQGEKTIKSIKTKLWGKFLRYNYFTADFSGITEEGLYCICWNDQRSNLFTIGNDVYKNHVWQPVIDYFLPVQMCHMRIVDHYRVWHDACHLDDALMAPTNLNHFDGYRQGASTLTSFKPYEHVKGLNEGGWHDAGDFDLRIESQIGTVALLAMMIEEFGLEYDATLIDHKKRLVEIHEADGKNDLIQQIEHGLKSILGGYRSLGRLYRGIICPTLDQYVMIGDAAASTDNVFWKPGMPENKRDDRMVFTEENTRHECYTGAGLAIASRALKKYNPELAEECLKTALALWKYSGEKTEAGASKAQFAAELLLTTGERKYLDELLGMKEEIIKQSERAAWAIGKVLNLIPDENFKKDLAEAVRQNNEKNISIAANSPFGVPYRPYIWGAGWNIQRFGVEQYYLHKAWPEITSPDFFLDALNFMLGVHPGQNTASFASGVGLNSVTTAYGLNRADWSYIPGGVVSGTALIRPDLPELKEWPYFWQQTEYVMGGGSTNFMFLVLAVDKYLNSK